MKNLKEMLEHDVESENVFFNLDDFAEIHSIDGRLMPCVISSFSSQDERRSSDMNGRKMISIGRSITPLYHAVIDLRVRASDYGDRPTVGRVLLFDDKRKLRVENVEETGGILHIFCGEVKI
jgi:hypothetical protein